MRDIEPDSPENVQASKENAAYIKMLKETDLCPNCGGLKFKSEETCEYCSRCCPMCGNDSVDDDTGMCSVCKDHVR